MAWPEPLAMLVVVVALVPPKGSAEGMGMMDGTGVLGGACGIMGVKLMLCIDDGTRPSGGPEVWVRLSVAVWSSPFQLAPKSSDPTEAGLESPHRLL